MTSKKEVTERRLKVKQLAIEGLSTQEIARWLKISLRTIQLDRKKINQSLFEDLKGNSVERILADFLLRYDSIYKEARKTFRETGNDNAKIGALRIMAQQERDKVQLLQNLGFLEKAADVVGFNGEKPLTAHGAIQMIHNWEKENKVKIVHLDNDSNPATKDN